jgi:preprotein translocase subunit YajC
MSADTNAIAITATESLPEAPTSVQSGLTSLVPMLLIFVVFYFLLIRPQEKKRKAAEALVSGVKKGEEIITHSGIYGTISKLNDTEGTAELKIAKDVTIKILKTAIADIVSRKEKVKA